MALLFAFVGGSAVALKRDSDDRLQQGIAALSLACLLGIYASVYLCEHQLLSPKKDGLRIAATTSPLKKASPPISLPSPPQFPSPQTVLTPATNSADSQPRETVESRKYLRADVTAKVDDIERRRLNGELTLESAYDALLQVLRDAH